jgi:hypothetical protein
MVHQWWTGFEFNLSTMAQKVWADACLEVMYGVWVETVGPLPSYYEDREDSWYEAQDPSEANIFCD